MTLSEIVQQQGGRIACRDGYKFSIATDAFAACTPVQDQGPWTAFEVVAHGMYAVDPRFQSFRRWCRYEGARYGFVPEAIVWEVIHAHGGLAE